MDFQKFASAAATHAARAAEHVRQMERLIDKPDGTGQANAQRREAQALGDLTAASSALAAAGEAIGGTGRVTAARGVAQRALGLTDAALGAIQRTATGERFASVLRAAQSTGDALATVRRRLDAVLPAVTPNVRSLVPSYALGPDKILTAGQAAGATERLLVLSTDDGEQFQFGLSTAAYDRLRRETRYNIAAQERIQRQEALQAVGAGGDTITVSGAIFTAGGAGAGQLDRLRAIGAALRPVQLTTGSGDVLGRYFLDRVGEEQDGLLADGTPRKQGFDLEFRRYGDDYQNI